jgi:hypothetical protein
MGERRGLGGWRILDFEDEDEDDFEGAPWLFAQRYWREEGVKSMRRPAR